MSIAGVLILTIGQNVDEARHIENLRTIYNHLNQLIPLDKLLFQTNKNAASTSTEDVLQINNQLILIDKIKDKLGNPFLPKFLVVFDDVWNADAMKPYRELALFCLVMSRMRNILQEFPAVKKVREHKWTSLIMDK